VSDTPGGRSDKAADAGGQVTPPVALPLGTAPAEVKPEATPADTQAVANTPGTLSWVGPKEVKIGDVFEVQLVTHGATGARTLPVNLRYSRDSIEVVTVEQGEQPGSQAAGGAGFSRQIDASAGVIRMNTLYPNGLNGNAVVSRMKFKALRAGPATLAVRSGPEGAPSGGEPDTQDDADPLILKLVVKPAIRPDAVAPPAKPEIQSDDRPLLLKLTSKL